MSFKKQLKKRIKAKGSWIVSILIAVATFYLLTWMIGNDPRYSVFPIKLLYAMGGIATLQWVIKITLSGVHYREIVEQHNVAYALIVLSFAIVIAAGLLA